MLGTDHDLHLIFKRKGRQYCERLQREIVDFRKMASSEIAHCGGATMVITHELRHHYCHHLGTAADPRKELAADRFAGAAMHPSKMSLDAALSAVPILDERPSKSHPGRADRVKAITDGWNDPAVGKKC